MPLPLPLRPGVGREIVGFGAMSALSFVLNVGTTFALVELVGTSPALAFAIGLSLVLITSFLLMRIVIFRARSASLLQQLGMYAPSALGFRVLEYLAFLLAHVVLGVHYQVAVIAILLISAVVKFLFYRQVVFAT